MKEFIEDGIVDKGISKILIAYKERLINLGSRNRSICSNKLHKKNGIDLTTIEKYTSNIISNIMKFLLQRSSNSILLIEDFNNVKLINGDNYINSYETREHALSEKQKDNINISKRLSAIWTTVDEIEKEKGLYEMYIGFPFVEGQFSDGKPCRAPLFLFPVSVKKEFQGWTLSNILTENIRININFMLAFKNINNSKFEIPSETEYENLKDIEGINNFNTGNIKDILKNINDYLKKIGIEVEIPDRATEVIKYTDYKKENYDEYQGKKMILLPYLVMGHFPLTNSSLYKEYEEMIENGVTNLIDDLLVLDTQEISNGSDEFINDGKKITIIEKDLVSVTELDYSQERAVKKAMEKENLVVYGPPGTGKSQVIANIIANYMWKQQKVLLVSEKRTALDVVYKRLGKVGLSNRMAIIHDSQKDRNELYKKVINLIDNQQEVSNNASLDTWIIQKISNNIDDEVRKLDSLAEELRRERPCGYALRELYNISKFSEGEFYKKLNVKKFNEINKEKLNNLEKKLELIIPSLKYDNKDNFLSKRKNFSKIHLVEKFDIQNNIKNIIEYFKNRKNNSLLNHIQNLTKKLKEEVENHNRTIETLISDSFENISKDMNFFLENIFFEEKNEYIKIKNWC